MLGNEQAQILKINLKEGIKKNDGKVKLMPKIKPQNNTMLF